MGEIICSSLGGGRRVGCPLAWFLPGLGKDGRTRALGAEGLDGVGEEAGVEVESDGVYVAALVRAEYVARAPDLEVFHGDLEARAKLCRGEHGLEALLCRLGEASVLGYEQVGVGAPGAASDTASKLVELGESEGVGAVDDKGVDVRDVEAGLDDGGAYENVHAAIGEVDHGLFEAVFAHLAVRDTDFGLGDEPDGCIRRCSRCCRRGCGGSRPARAGRSRGGWPRG